MCCRLGFQTNGTGFLPSLGQQSSNLETAGLVRKWFPQWVLLMCPDSRLRGLAGGIHRCPQGSSMRM